MTTVAGDPYERDLAEASSITAPMPALNDFTVEIPRPDVGPDNPHDNGHSRPPRSAEVAHHPPEIDHLASAGIAGLVGAALTITARLGATPLLIAVAAVQGLLVVSWVLGTKMPGRIGGLVIGGLAAVGADVVVSRWPHGQLGTLLGVLGLAIPAMFIHQLSRGVVRARVVESLSDVAVLVMSVVAFAALIQLRHESGGALMVSGVVLAATGALVAGHLVDMAWPMPRFDPEVSRGLFAVIVGAVVGAALAFVRLHNTIEFTSGRAAFLGAAIGGIVGLFAIGAAFVEQASSKQGRLTRTFQPVFGVLLALGLLSPVGYLLCLAIRG